MTAEAWPGRELPAEIGMPAGDAEFARQHAADYAAGAGPEAAIAYADWYAREYLPGAGGLEDLPDHPTAWARFADREIEAEPGA